MNGLANCDFIAGDVLKVVEELTDKPDLIILDPPRDGIHPKALDKIIDFGVDRMVYISCKPTSLVRDLVVLQERGYRLEKACAVDMFPDRGTDGCLVRGKNPLRIWYMRMWIMSRRANTYLQGMKGNATYREIRSQAEYGMSVSSLYVAQIKDKCGFESVIITI